MKRSMKERNEMREKNTISKGRGQGSNGREYNKGGMEEWNEGRSEGGKE